MKLLLILAVLASFISFAEPKNPKAIGRDGKLQDKPREKWTEEQVACAPDNIMCNIWGHNNDLNRAKPFGFANNKMWPSDCWKMCQNEEIRERCVSFGHNRREMTCAFYEYPLAEFIRETERVAGTWFWDAACFDCKVSQDPAF